VHRELGALSPADLRRVGRQLDQFPAPRRLLVQWVPHAFGYRSMNVGFCRWLWSRAARHGDRVEVMAHEAFLSFGRNWKQTGAALVHRLMTVLLLRAAAVVWVSIPEWEERFRPYTLGRRVPFRWLPIPSNIPVVDHPAAVERIRLRYRAGSGMLIGHFGTHGWPITSVLEPILSVLRDEPELTILLIGVGSEEFRKELLRRKPELGPLIQATGPLPPEDLSAHITACDLLIQPYPDGVSSRRGSMMVGLAHSKPIVTTWGPLTAPLWREAGALRLAPAKDAPAFAQLIRELCRDPQERHRMGLASRKLYDEHFELSHTISSLRGSASLEYSGCAY
jgi:glycosyltransferase involved in cell wall biosynthesis